MQREGLKVHVLCSRFICQSAKVQTVTGDLLPGVRNEVTQICWAIKFAGGKSALCMATGCLVRAQLPIFLPVYEGLACRL